MTLDQVIEDLIKKREEHGGDVPVFVNGEYGIEDIELSKEDHFDIGPADIVLDCDHEDRPEGIRRDTIVMQIGGY